MSGGEPPAALRPGLAALDRRLDPASRAPLAVGFSGGGDSLALLRLVLAWAAPPGRRVLALTVDHGLHPDSAAWTERAGESVRRLRAASPGLDWRALAWTGDKPAAGLQAAARDARHALLADAARKAGAIVLLMGHTADDRDESELIRCETPAHGRLREWAPSPAWPEGHGVFLLRPLLEVRRAELRAWLAAEGCDWLEDPANADARYARTRARAALRTPFPLMGGRTADGDRTFEDDRGRRPQSLSLRPCRAPLYPWPSAFEGQGFSFSRAELLAGAAPANVLVKALVCVSGRRTPPAGAAVRRLIDRLRGGGAFTVTLGGARMQTTEAVVLLSREAGRSPPEARALPPGEPVVFDGRFELMSREGGWRVERLKGHAAALPSGERDALRPIRPETRPTLPVLLSDAGAVRLPAPLGAGPAEMRDLAPARFVAALGGTLNETEAARLNACGGGPPLILS